LPAWRKANKKGMRPQAIDNLIRVFSKFPGIGPRQAARFVYWLADSGKPLIEELSASLLALRTIDRCSNCFRAHSGAASCSICSDPNRDAGKIAVVERDTDLEAMEKSGVYDGHYHVLGGLLSLLDDESRNRLRLKEIFSRTKKNGKLNEVILALSATPEGEFSARYIEKILEPAQKEKKFKITRLGRGLSAGAELEYLNRDTLKNALENRK